MIATENLTLSYGKRTLFEDVNLKFTPGHCYGVIGANGAGKSTLLKILSGEIDSTSGKVIVPPGLRMSVLKQDHFAYNDDDALTAVLKGHERLYQVMTEKDEIYQKPDFGDEDGVRAAELETEFADLNGWEAESQAGELLCGLGIPVDRHRTLIKDLDDSDRVRVLLAQAVFGEPDILLLDEPTNHLDVDSILWLEEFLIGFQSTVVVVSHDRHFLNRVCTHTADIDFKKIQVYTGNYDFWKAASELALKHRRASEAKAEEKAKELKEFIRRFSANASKSKQATARKKMLDKLNVEQFNPSNRKYPHVVFSPEKLHSKGVLEIEGLAASAGGEKVFEDFRLMVTQGERIAVVSQNSLATTALLEILGEAQEPDAGQIRWGSTVKRAYLPKDHGHLFDVDLNLIDWLRQYSDEKEEGFVRGFLGRMLFTGEETLKKANVLSGGEKVRCMISRMMLREPQCMVLDGPTNHLDLESITSLNNALMKYQGTLIFASHDVEFVESLADRVLEIKDGKVIDHQFGYKEYLRRHVEELGLASIA